MFKSPPGKLSGHAFLAFSLGAQALRQRQAGALERRGQQDGNGVGLGFGQDGIGAAQQAHQRLQRQQPARSDHAAQPQSKKKARAGGAVRLFLFPCAQIQADKAAAACTHPEAQCREHRGYGKHNAHRCYGGPCPAAPQRTCRPCCRRSDEQVMMLGTERERISPGTGAVVIRRCCASCCSEVLFMPQNSLRQAYVPYGT